MVTRNIDSKCRLNANVADYCKYKSVMQSHAPVLAFHFGRDMNIAFLEHRLFWPL